MKLVFAVLFFFSNEGAVQVKVVPVHDTVADCQVKADAAAQEVLLQHLKELRDIKAVCLEVPVRTTA